MIAVEWNDWDAPRAPDHSIVPRQGQLLHVGMAKVKGDREPVNAAWIIVSRMHHDEGSQDAGEKIIRAVHLGQITVQGVHIPFEPYEAPK